ncbi:hypothetical protein B0H66DRAFT_468412 [Apodospora peruviana]|uniref:Fungal N-terminal domain-containing protein n=1 Tax=Apodospora peruviana TaxID=516989 RepID=A0AAE0IVT4_9PEZI|nr:hypothetical protein B0H66DRAFT_468412 [Apodospora peruviana]
MELGLTLGAVGDIISITVLIKDIVSALSEARGSSKAYRDLVESLNVLHQMLHEADRVYSDEPHDSAVRLVALNTVGQIRNCLRRFDATIQKYGPSLAQGGSGCSLMDGARKLQWKLLEEKDVDKFRSEIMGYSQSLTTLLCVTNIRMAKRQHDDVLERLSSIQGQTQSIARQTDRFQTYMGSVSKGIVSQLSYISELGTGLKSSAAQVFSLMQTMSDDIRIIHGAILRLERPLAGEHEYFMLIDYTGSFPIYPKTITSWEAFEFVVADRFQGTKAARRILDQSYELVAEPSIFCTSNTKDNPIRKPWDSTFSPYMYQNIGILVVYNPLMAPVTCSKCFAVFLGDIDGWCIW